MEIHEKHEIDVTVLENKKDVFRGFLTYKKIRKFQAKRKEQAKRDIIEKLVKELNRQDQIDAIKNKTYEYKVKRKERIVKDMEVVGTKIELVIS